MSKLTKNGVSTTKGRRVFKFERWFSYNGTSHVQWDYRDSKGVLHSGVAMTVKQGKAKAEKASGEKIQ